MRKNLIILFLVFLGSHLSSQNDGSNLPQNYFGPPLDIPLVLAGNFAELRSNHFHAGIDIKTQGVEGKNVLASADGYVSRIKVQEGGYGRVIYIDHPNGYTTAYAHLQSFSKKIDRFVKEEQYHNESYTVDFYPKKNTIKVAKGEIIALSGNSGGSGGPHLHFEIRDTKSEAAQNVLLFNLPIKDNTAPIIKGISIYPLDDNAAVNGTISPTYISTVRKGKDYSIQSVPIVQGKIGFGIETLDLMNGTSNRCGVYNIQLWVDNILVFEQETNEVAFEESRYINSHTDYLMHQSKHRWIHKSYVDPNNKLSIYKNLKQDGEVLFKKDSIHSVKYIVMDAYGNNASLNFDVRSKFAPSFLKKAMPENFAKTLAYHKYNEFQNESILVQFEKNSFYNDINFTYSSAPHAKERWSAVHSIHNDYAPLHTPMKLFLKCSFPADVDPVTLIAVRKTSSGHIRIHTGEYNNGYFNFESKYFGDFYIYHDNTAPTIKSLNIYNGKNIAKQRTISFKISDDLSGINTYNCYVDGKWILMEYDYKRNLIEYLIDDKISPGKHQLKLVVQDAVGNENMFECTFTR